MNNNELDIGWMFEWSVRGLLNLIDLIYEFYGLFIKDFNRYVYFFFICYVIIGLRVLESNFYRKKVFLSLMGNIDKVVIKIIFCNYVF